MAGEQKDTTNDIMWALAAVMGFVIFILWKFAPEIKATYLTIKLWELKFVTSFWHNDKLINYINIIQTKPISEWTYSEVFGEVGVVVGSVFNFVYLAIMGFISYMVWSKNPTQKFKRILTMQTLKESEQRIWPYIAPVVKLNLIKEDVESGPFAMSLTPYDFAKKYKLLEDEKNVNSLNRNKAQKLFISQLGKMYGGHERLKKHELAFLLIFAAQGCGDKEGAMNAINSIALSAAGKAVKKMPDFSSIEPLKKYLNDPEVQKIINKHAYVYTLLAEMLEFARTKGVFPDSFWKWLKPRDRVLYYALNCVGRQVCFAEIAGIFGHWKAEQIAKHKLETPFVDKAVDGLEKALAEVKVV